MSASLIQLNFNLNRDFISKTLCINKNDLSLDCKGKCYLSKQLKEDKKNKNSENPYNLLVKQFNLFFQKHVSYQIEPFTLNGSLFDLANTTKLLQSGFVDQLEFPPEC